MHFVHYLVAGSKLSMSLNALVLMSLPAGAYSPQLPASRDRAWSTRPNGFQYMMLPENTLSLELDTQIIFRSQEIAHRVILKASSNRLEELQTRCVYDAATVQLLSFQMLPRWRHCCAYISVYSEVAHKARVFKLKFTRIVEFLQNAIKYIALYLLPPLCINIGQIYH